MIGDIFFAHKVIADRICFGVVVLLPADNIYIYYNHSKKWEIQYPTINKIPDKWRDYDFNVKIF